MEWLKDYWWIILIFLAGVFINTIKALNKLNFKSYIDKKGIKPILYDDEDNNKIKRVEDKNKSD
ncbi:YpfN family protein [Gilliamella sp. G0441]|uniref:YpfN family protein n=1 Tax=Gilliamella sp. G0441 TaxID=3384760 RepID=UPI003D328447